jgi:hypothetical protein
MTAPFFWGSLSYRATPTNNEFHPDSGGRAVRKGSSPNGRAPNPWRDADCSSASPSEPAVGNQPAHGYWT